MASLLNCASASIKSEVNQDYYLKIAHPTLGFSGMVVADGIGSHFRSEIGARLACEELKKLVELVASPADLDFEFFFKLVRESLIKLSEEDLIFQGQEIVKDKTLGTTLICVLELDKEYVLAYAGNGSIWHISGGFNQFSPAYYLPWNAINLLNPHASEEGGKSALYRYISITDHDYTPTVVRLSKDTTGFGEIIVATTDGVYTSDQARVGKDDQQTLWIRGEESMPLLYTHLSAFLSAAVDDLTDIDLGEMLDDYLTAMKNQGIMDDDTTLGVIISDKALGYHRQLANRRIQNIPADGNDTGQ